jgi:hypothetical protein
MDQIGEAITDHARGQQGRQRILIDALGQIFTGALPSAI